MKKLTVAISYAGMMLASAALGHFQQMGKEGFAAMGTYDWLMFDLLIFLQVCIVMRALANGTFVNGLPPKT